MSQANLRINFFVLHVMSSTHHRPVFTANLINLFLASSVTQRCGLLLMNYCNKTTTRALNCGHQSFVIKQTTLAPRRQRSEYLENKAN